MNRNRKMNRRPRRRSDAAEVGRLLPFHDCLEERIQAVARVADAWLSKKSIWMRRAEREIPAHNPCSSEMVRACLTRAFAGHHVPALRAWVQRDLPDKPAFPSEQSDVLIVPPSTVFAAVWQAATAAWLAGARVILNPSRREPAFSRLLAESITALAGHVLPVRRADFLGKEGGSPQLKRPALRGIVAYGNDQTLEHFRTLARSNVGLIGFGARISLAYLDKRALTIRKIRALTRAAAEDATLYDTQGCLSPRCFYIEEGGAVSPRRFAEELAGAMRDLDRKIPRRKTDEDRWMEEAFWQRWVFRQTQGRACFFGQRDRYVILERGPRLEPSSLKRVVFVKPVKSMAEMLAHSADWHGRVSTIAVTQSANLRRLQQALGMKTGIRFCAPWEMHQPPAGWRNCGLNLPGTVNQWISRT